MALLSAVINEFKKNFNYLNENQQRRSRCYEFWFFASCKKKLTNTALTQKLEVAARNCLDSLNGLAEEDSDFPFENYQEQFFLIVLQAVKVGQVQRFTYGSVHTSCYNIGHQSILERSIVAKDPGLFEKEMVNALRVISNKYPEHQPFFNTLIEKIQTNTLSSYVFFEESAKADANGKFYYSERQNSQLAFNLYDLEERQEFAEEYISSLTP
ncbi:Uncharacterised protein [Legionella busanensis]|uniref:Uncharacterized protein n=1 Tax=Legionella busanensis TaxID=190655 RepID=A0A378JKI6_9GAMM|nr:hypothetical protein [Legionella busanensis]STX51597.1 Uncharacterised protein [Legionella busanensis]